jgi:phospholipase/carboxylesterase
VRLFLPTDYLPKYAYPLVVLCHPDGSDEEAISRLAPRLSRRNYVVACPRGPVAFGPSDCGRPAFGWCGKNDEDYLGAVTAGVIETYHVHPGRVYLMGVGAGAAAACRFARSLGNAVAGVIVLNGELPQRLPCRRGLRVFVGHGTGNSLVPLSVARRSARRLIAAGADLRFEAYPTTDRVGGDMLRDVNRWIMEAVISAGEPNSTGS